MKTKILAAALCLALLNAVVGGSMASAQASTQFHPLVLKGQTAHGANSASPMIDSPAYIAAAAAVVASAVEVAKAAQAVTLVIEALSSSSSSSGYVPGKAPAIAHTAYLSRLARDTFDR